MDLPLSEAILRLFLAFLLGSVVGMEREYTQQSAGLRTHILVCLGATVFTLVSISDMTTGLTAIHNTDPDGLGGAVSYRVTHDPGRIAAQIVSGIGFIGGGAVLRHGANIRGLTTAASLWMMASIGMLLGVGAYQLAIVATLFSFLVLFIVGSLERTMFRKYLKRFALLHVQLTAQTDMASGVERWLEDLFPGKTTEVRLQRNEEAKTVIMTYSIDIKGLQPDINSLSRQLNTRDGILSATLKVLHEEKE
jgi:putative Mg2+ transporter-C (MgtC) family protein